MTFSLKASLGIVACLAVMFAGVNATLRLPALESSLPAGLLLALISTLAIIGLARAIATFPTLQPFWAGFLAACTICTIISFSDSIQAANVVPEHLARYLWNLGPKNTDSAADQNTRFYALQRFINLGAIMTLAVLGGLTATNCHTGVSTDAARSRDVG